MKITTVLFDLDGTLLPMDQEEFIRAYFGRLAEHMEPYGYEKEKLLKTIWASTGSMIHNQTGRSNEAVFWECMEKGYGPQIRLDEPKFNEFYRVGFPKVQASCGFTPMAAKVIAACKQKGLRIALATNPFFPATATHQRIGWAGMEKEDFEWITTYENSHACKPNPAYYKEVLETLNVAPEECLMVGNDVQEDMMTRELGMSVFLLTPCLINRENADIAQFPHGDYDKLLEYIITLA